MEILKLQRDLPWGAHGYSNEYNADTAPIREFRHATLVHLAVPLGKLAKFRHDFHYGLSCEIVPKALADIVICTMRAANVVPGGPIILADLRRDGHFGDGDYLACLMATQVHLGMLAKFVDGYEHESSGALDAAIVGLNGMLGCAERMALNFPGGEIDINEVVLARLADKFPDWIEKYLPEWDAPILLKQIHADRVNRLVSNLQK